MAKTIFSLAFGIFLSQSLGTRYEILCFGSVMQARSGLIGTYRAARSNCHLAA